MLKLKQSSFSYITNNITKFSIFANYSLPFISFVKVILLLISLAENSI